MPQEQQSRKVEGKEKRENGAGRGQSQFIEFAYFLVLHYVKQFFLLCFQRICRLLLDFVIKDLFVFTSALSPFCIGNMGVVTP